MTLYPLDRQALIQAAVGDDASLFEQLLPPLLADLEPRDVDMALRLAGRTEQPGIICLLMDARVDLPERALASAFLHVVQTDRIDLAARLLQQGVDPRTRMVRNGLPRVLDPEDEFDRAILRLEAAFDGARPRTGAPAARTFDEDSREGVTPLMLAAAKGRITMLQWLLDGGADVNEHDANGGSALLSALDAEQVEGARLLLERGAKIDAPRLDHWHPLLSAAASESIASLQLLQAHGADLAVSNAAGESPIRQSLLANRPANTRWLIAQGVELPRRFSDDYPATMAAALGECRPIQDQLLQRGDDLHARWPERDIDALMRVAEEGLAEMVPYLVALGADPLASNRDGDTACSLARKAGRDDVVAWFEENYPVLRVAPPIDTAQLRKIARQLCTCMPGLEVKALLDNRPAAPALRKDASMAVLHWLADELSGRGYLHYVEWKDFHGELPAALHLLQHVPVASFRPEVIDAALDQHGWPDFPDAVPYLEYQNHFLAPHGLCIVTLEGSGIENLYLLCVKNEPRQIQRLHALLAPASLHLGIHPPLGPEACIERIRNPGT